MGNLTVIQELIKELEEIKQFPLADKITIEVAIEAAKNMIKKEKEQIFDAYCEGYQQDNYNGKEDYYSKTFVVIP